MFVVKIWGNPDDDVCVDAGGIGDCFPEMVVVRWVS
jgi:hypothetical protein